MDDGCDSPSEVADGTGSGKNPITGAQLRGSVDDERSSLNTMTSVQLRASRNVQHHVEDVMTGALNMEDGDVHFVESPSQYSSQGGRRLTRLTSGYESCADASNVLDGDEDETIEWERYGGRVGGPSRQSDGATSPADRPSPSTRFVRGGRR